MFSRYISYLTDTVLLICLTSLILSFFKISPQLFILTLLYSMGTHYIYTISYVELAKTVGIYFAISIIYFTLEIYYNTSIGNRIMGLEVRIEDKNASKLFRYSIIRSFIKSIPPVEFFDSLFILKNPRFNFKLSDSILRFIVLRQKKSGKGCVNLIIISLILYYIPLLTIIISTYLVKYALINNSSSFGSPIQNASINSLSFYQLFNIIFSNNFTLSIELILGGTVLSIPTVLTIFTSSYIEGTIFTPAAINTPSLFLKAVLPEFFPETLAYVFSITASLIIVSYFITFIDYYTHGKSFADWVDNVDQSLKFLLAYFLITITLLFSGAIIESYVATYILR
ncbi:MAG: stage II sporulation protein M [Cuniculiplasma sp.]